jgi:hypothetical protein
VKFFKRISEWNKKPDQSISDPVFGKMSFHRGSWVAYVNFPHAREPVEVSVWGKDGPSEYQQAVWQKLTRDYDALEPHIENALFNEYETALKSDESMAINDHYLTGEYLLKKAGEIWKIAQPLSIDIYPARYSTDYDCRVYFAFPVDSEHNRSVFLWDGKLVLVMPE